MRALARDYGTTKPAAIRLNYGMQRVRGGGNAARLIAILPCLVGAWRHRAGGLLLSSSGWFPATQRAALQRPDLLAGRRPRTINMSTIGDDLLRETGDLADSRFGPRIEALVVYNSNPVAVAPESPKVVAGLRARRPVHRGAGALPDRHRRPSPTTCCRPPRSSSTWTCTQLRPHLRADQRAGDRAARRGPAEHADLSRAGGAHGLRRALLRRRATRTWRAAPSAGGDGRLRFRRAARARLGQAAAARGAVRRRRLPHAERQVP